AGFVAAVQRDQGVDQSGQGQRPEHQATLLLGRAHAARELAPRVRIERQRAVDRVLELVGRLAPALAGERVLRQRYARAQSPRRIRAGALDQTLERQPAAREQLLAIRCDPRAPLARASSPSNARSRSASPVACPRAAPTATASATRNLATNAMSRRSST